MEAHINIIMRATTAAAVQQQHPAPNNSTPHPTIS
jgi:hypothetical protein